MGGVFLLFAKLGAFHNWFLNFKWVVKVTQSCLTLCDPMDYTAHGILQARILEWVAFPFSRGSSQTRNWAQVSHIAGRFFTSWAISEAIFEVLTSYQIYDIQIPSHIPWVNFSFCWWYPLLYSFLVCCSTTCLFLLLLLLLSVSNLKSLCPDGCQGASP